MRIKLPEPVYSSSVSIEEALKKRRSIRDFRDDPLKLSDVSQILWSAQGINDRSGFRTAPSAGALYPLEVYIAVGSVSGLNQGIYKYDPFKHELAEITGGDRRDELCRAALGQESVREGSIVIVISAVYKRVTQKYRERGIRYVHIEAGHAVQNIYLQALSLGLGTVVIGAFSDNEVQSVMKMQDNEEALCIMPVGKLRK